jgi:hypothetical protein
MERGTLFRGILGRFTGDKEAPPLGMGKQMLI